MDDIKIGNWMYNINESETWEGEQFETKQEAITQGKEQAIHDNEFYIKCGVPKKCVSSYEIGQISQVFPSGVDVDSILENVAENTGDEAGEAAEDYLMDVTNEDSTELEEKLNEVLFDWMKRHSYEPDFYIMENIELKSI